MKNELICAIISAIAGAISGGVVNLLLEVRKERKEADREKKKAYKKAYENRPELEIVDYKNYIERTSYGVKKECDINIFLGKIERVSVEDGCVTAHYCEENFNSNDWCCIIYTFKNVGKKDIACINPICMYKRDTVLCDVKFIKQILGEGILSYTTWYEKEVHAGDTFTMKVCYHKDCVISGMLTAIMDMGMEDVDGIHWVQPLFAPDNKIYQSSMMSYKEYREQLLPDKAMECFEKPWLW